MLIILKSIIPRIHRDGCKFIIPTVAIAIFLSLSTDYWILIRFAWVLAAFVVVFFRDPTRIPPDDRHVVVAPADGVIVSIEPAVAPLELEMKTEDHIRISIFLNLLDVHINRIPISGIVKATRYRKGRLWSTAMDKSSTDNERMATRIDTDDGREIAVCQIAGPFVRRIRCDLVEFQRVETGERFGLIRFGSRTDIYLPADARVLVKVGQRAVGGETILASLSQM